LDTDIALDQDFSAVHLSTDIIEPIARALNADLFGIAHAQLKEIANFDAATRRLQVDLLDLVCRFARKALRYERRQIEPLIGTAAEGQCQRRHGSNSRKW
jgi:hypothetical protein